VVGYLPHSHVHNERTVHIIMTGCITYARKVHISTSAFKSDVTIVFLDPDFPKKRKFYAIRIHLRQKIGLLNIFMGFRTSWPKMGLGWGQNRGKSGAILTPLPNSFFYLGVLTSVPILVKINQEVRPWECPQTDRPCDMELVTRQSERPGHQQKLLQTFTEEFFSAYWRT